MEDLTKTELETILKDTESHLAETKRMGPGYYGIRGRCDYAVEADERYIEKLKNEIAEYDQDKLNENQQVVFDWLEAYADKDSGDWPMQAIWYFIDLAGMNRLGNEDKRAFARLDRKEQFELLAAFAEWGMKEVAE